MRAARPDGAKMRGVREIMSVFQHYNENIKMGEVCGKCGVYFPSLDEFLLHLTKRYNLVCKKEFWSCPTSPILIAGFDKKTQNYARKVQEYY